MKNIFSFFYRKERPAENVIYIYIFNQRVVYRKRTTYTRLLRILWMRFEKINYRKYLVDQSDGINRVNKSICKLIKNYDEYNNTSCSINKYYNSRNSIINIVYIFDEKYLLPTIVSIQSLLNSRNIRRSNFYDIYLITTVREQGKLDIFKNFESYSNLKINIIKCNDKDINFPKIETPGFHVSFAAVLKFYIPEILNFKNKVLYIDSDTIINKDISELYFSNLNNSYAAVVEDIKPKILYKPPILQKLKIKSHKAYFNSGMMLLNLEKLRDDGIINKLIEYRKTGINYFMDQDAFNVCFANKVKLMSLRFNCLIHNFDCFDLDTIKKEYKLAEKYNTFNGLLGDMSIVHYSSKDKPWSINKPYNELWYKNFLTLNYCSKNFCSAYDSSYKYLAENKIIVSLTSYGKRLSYIKPCLDSLLSQKFNNFIIVLWLSKNEFNDDNLPEFIKSMVCDKLKIMYCDDLKSYKKLIPSLELFPENIIVTADDDIIYKNTWLIELISSYLIDKKSIHCHRAHLINYFNHKFEEYSKFTRNVKSDNSSFKFLPTGCGGVLYPPNSLNKKVLDYENASKYAPTGDDIWFWLHAVLNMTKIKIVGQSSFELSFIPNTQEESLYKINDIEKYNDVMFDNIIQYLNKYFKGTEISNLLDAL